MRTTLLSLALGMLALAPALAQDEPEKPRPYGVPPEAEKLLDAAAEVTKTGVLVKGSAPRLPVGTRVTGTLAMAGQAIKWRRAFVGRGGTIRMLLPTSGLEPGVYAVWLRYSIRLQPNRLIPHLRNLHLDDAWDGEVTFGDAAAALAANERTLAKLERDTAKVDEALAKLDAMVVENAKLINNEAFSPAKAMLGWRNWITSLEALEKPLRDQAARKTPRYGEALAQLINIVDKAAICGRGFHRDELYTTSQPVPPEFSQLDPQANDPVMMRKFLAYEREDLGTKLRDAAAEIAEAKKAIQAND